MSCVNIIIVDSCGQLNMANSRKNQENRKKCTFQPHFLLLLVWLKNKNARYWHFRSLFISTGPNNQRFWKFIFYKILGHFDGLPNLLLCAIHNFIINDANVKSNTVFFKNSYTSIVFFVRPCTRNPMFRGHPGPSKAPSDPKVSWGNFRHNFKLRKRLFDK